jgi:hypothetical protein
MEEEDEQEGNGTQAIQARDALHSKANYSPAKKAPGVRGQRE